MTTSTRADVRTRVRNRLSAFDLWTDAELNAEIQASVAHFHDLVLTIDRSAALSVNDLAVTAGTPDYDLLAWQPTFYELVAIDVLDATQPSGLSPVERYNYDERHRYQAYGQQLRDVRYEVRGGKLRLYPTPTQSGTLRIGWIPTATVLAADGTTFLAYNFMEEWVVADVMQKAAPKRRDDPTPYQARKAEMERIMRQNVPADHARPRTIVDVQGWNGR